MWARVATVCTRVPVCAGIDKQREPLAGSHDAANLVPSVERQEDVYLRLWVTAIVMSLALPIAVAREQKAGLELLQQAFRDWKEGERNSLTARAWSELFPAITMGRWHLAATVRLSYGLQYLDLGDTLPSLLLPSENDVTTELRLTLKQGWLLDPYVAAGFSTVLGESFRLQGMRRTRTARWWDPVTSSQSIGFGYGGDARRTPQWELRLGAELRQVRAREHALLTDNPRTPQRETYRAESGIQCKGRWLWQLDSLRRWQGEGELRLAFAPEWRWSATLEQRFRQQVWKFLEFNLQLTLTYDPLQSRKLQYRQRIGIATVYRW